MSRTGIVAGKCCMISTDDKRYCSTFFFGTFFLFFFLFSVSVIFFLHVTFIVSSLFLSPVLPEADNHLHSAPSS